MRKETLFKILVIGSTLIMFVVNALSNILPINGFSTKELSDAIPIYFVPAGYVFSIWGLIYIGIIVYLIAMFKNFTKEDMKIAPWIVVANLSNTGWIFLWHYKMVYTSVILMTVLLISLLAIYTIIDKKDVSLLKKIPFSIYLGWISVASIANISAALYIAQWNGFGISSELWTVIMIGIVGIITILMLNLKKDISYSLVIIWALAGILVKLGTTVPMIYGAIVLALIVLCGILLSTVYQKLDLKR